jgi:hypothetical protein
MRIYEVQGNGIHRFVRTFEEARAVIREQNPAAKKIKGSELPEMMFEDGWTVGAIDMDTTKAGIIGQLNRAINKGKHAAKQPMHMHLHPDPVKTPIPSIEMQELKEDNRLLADDVDRLESELAELKKQSVNLAVKHLDQSTELHSISPPISYPNLPKNCKGKCLHCDKEVGWLLHTGK